MIDFSLARFRAGLIDALPFLLSTLILSATFGAAAIGAGLGPLTAVTTSIIVYSGSGQFAALPLWRESIAVLGLSTFVLSLRFLLMTASMAPRVAAAPLWLRAALAFCLTDENYALTVSRRKGELEPDYLVGTWVVIYGSWVVGTAIGALLGAQVPIAWIGPLSAVFPIVFLVLIVLVCTTRVAAVVAVLGAVLGVVGALFIPGGWNVVVAGLLASLAGPLLERLTSADPEP